MALNFYDKENTIILLESSRNFVISERFVPNMLEFLGCPKLIANLFPMQVFSEISFSHANIIGSAQGGEVDKLVKLAIGDNIIKGRGPFEGLQNIEKIKKY